MSNNPLELPLPRRDEGEVQLVSTTPSRARDFGAATKARVRAMDVLFEADARGIDVADLAQERTQRSTAQTPLPEASRRLAELYATHSSDVDELISSHSEAWELARMPAVDRAVLRMGTAEIMWGEGTDPVVLIKEYTRIASEISTDHSAAFVNALLQRVADMKELLA